MDLGEGLGGTRPRDAGPQRHRAVSSGPQASSLQIQSQWWGLGEECAWDTGCARQAKGQGLLVGQSLMGFAIAP
jgi:hypothetical protein